MSPVRRQTTTQTGGDVLSIKLPETHLNMNNYVEQNFFDKVGHLLNHWGRMTHICVSKLTIIASDNGLSPDRRQAIIWTSAGILLIRTLGTNFSEILISKFIHFHSRKCFWQDREENGGHFLSASMCLSSLVLVKACRLHVRCHQFPKWMLIDSQLHS